MDRTCYLVLLAEHKSKNVIKPERMFMFVDIKKNNKTMVKTNLILFLLF